MKITVFYAGPDNPPVPAGLKTELRHKMIGHDGPIQITREHDQWFVGCNACGMICSYDGPGNYEQIELGDESCPAMEV